MARLAEKNACCGCQACFNICPVSAITMEPDEEGFIYPVLDADRCIHCERCTGACPVLNRPHNNPYRKVYAAYASDKNERMRSSSGGVFSVLARLVLDSGGAVCGAAYQEDVSVHHMLVEDENSLAFLKGTKYVQSSTDKVYTDVLRCLDEGKTVLFCGTPCQAAGLRSFLGRDRDNLLCVDLICHGVPSPAVWMEYLREISPENPVSKAEFRHKKENGEGAFIRFELENGQIIEEKQDSNLYMKGFLQNCYLRPSCFHCPFKGFARCSDITIGDFWSIHETHPSFADKYGNSAVIVHSEKGKRWFGKAVDQLCIEDASEEQALLWNECIAESVKRTDKRAVFFSKWRKEPVIDTLSWLTDEPKPVKETRTAFSRVKRILRRIMR